MAKFESAETYMLAGIGAAQGAWRYYRPQPSTLAWVGLAAGIVAYEIAAPPGQLMSEAVDRALEHSNVSKLATLGAIGCTALHLSNVLPDRLDPFKRTLDLLRRV